MQNSPDRIIVIVSGIASNLTVYGAYSNNHSGQKHMKNKATKCERMRRTAGAYRGHGNKKTSRSQNLRSENQRLISSMRRREVW
jgi:uncharacterized protein YaiI (UPF0178 family)